jgi:hydrogenase large subunit
MERLNLIRDLIPRAIDIVENLYLPDLLAVASFYPEWTKIGGGLGNYMAYGDLPQNGIGDISKFRIPRGVILNKNLAEVLPVDLIDPGQVQEGIAHSWYQYPAGQTALHPYDGVTEPNYTGPQPPYDKLDETKAYSWLKTPRWKGNAMEVGPLSRMLVGFASGRTDYKDVVMEALGQLKVGPEALFSTLGRTAARGLETRLCAHWLQDEFDQLITNLKNGDSTTADTRYWSPETWKPESKGYGFTEAPRGALCHWIQIKDKKIANYQIVVPSTWNASPRDAKGQLGAYESALLGTPMADPKRPLEILRTIHSFDPCLACASHVIGPDGEKLAEIIVR